MSKTYPVEKLNNVEWSQINWRKVERYVFKLQQRIFQASRDGKIKSVRKLQRTLTRSYMEWKIGSRN